MVNWTNLDKVEAYKELEAAAKVNLKELPPQKRISYIWDYYKFVIIGVIFAIYFIISGIYDYVTQKECIFELIMINGTVPYTNQMDIGFAEDFLLSEGFEPQEQEIVVSTLELKLSASSYQQDYYVVQSLIARLESPLVAIIQGS